MFKRLIDAVQGKAPLSAKRSSRWPTVRAEHLRLHPACAVCGGTDKVEVHHVKPFHLHPELELDPSNFISLCEARAFVNCHLFVGHLGNFKSFNPDVIAMSAQLHDAIANRPTGGTAQ